MGADVCLWKPIDERLLQGAVEKCLTTTYPGPAAAERPGEVYELEDGGFFVVASPAMQRLRVQIEQVARIDVPVLCLGDSGTGKEVIARFLHRLSNRAKERFLKVNCAALPSELLESELFGYERGAFTGAVHSKPGKFDLANHGTLFLDEIAEMPTALQAKLLHVLQDQEFSRLGGNSRIKVDVRIVAATNVNIRKAIAAKAFREDLYYRLSTFVFSIPPLRDRREEVPILLNRYLKLYANRLGLPLRFVSNDLMEQCLRYTWPGNVRELENFAKRYLICGEERLQSNPASEVFGATSRNGNAANFPVGDLKSQVRVLKNGAEASAIARALEETTWNRKEAAKILNISYKSLLSKIREYGLDNVGHASSNHY
jgi:DNA-binding NtrC family response regulator